MTTVLITGFEPFGGEIFNPSWEAVKRLPDELSDAKLVKCELPVTLDGSFEAVKREILRVRPDIIINVGQAGDRSGITPERVAINVDDFDIPDNSGCQLTDVPIVSDGPAGYFSSLPIKRIVAALAADGIPSSLSDSAGTYICNHVFYRVRHFAPDTMAGFIHVPYETRQVTADKPSLPLDTMVRGLTLAVETSIKALSA